MLGAGPNVTLRTKLFYGFGSVAYGVKDQGFNYFLLFYYVQVIGLEAKLAGLAILIAMIVDAASDPIVGYISDNWHSKWGRRHPFMYFAAVPVALTYFFIWNPPDSLSTTGLFWYLTGLAVFIRTLITLYEIPSTALVSELTDSYDQRTSVLSFRYFFGWWGGLVMALLAYTVFLQPDAEFAIGQLNPRGYEAYGIAASCIMVFAILISCLGTHRYIPYLRKPPEKRPFSAKRWVREIAETISHRSFLVLFVSMIFFAFATGLTAALNLYFATYFWELTTDQIKLFVLAYMLAAIFALVVAPRASKRWDKKKAAIGTAVLAAALAPAPFILRLLGWFPENGSDSLVPILLAFSGVDVAFVISASILSSSMIADVVEDSELRTGRRSEGVFFAVRTFARKSVSGLGIFLSSLVLSAVSFPAGAKPGEVEAGVLVNLALVYSALLVAIYMISITFLAGYRITRDTHDGNLERLSAQPGE